MKRFAALLENLAYTNARNEKLRHLRAYFAETPDPDRGLAVAAIAGTLDLPSVTPKTIRNLAEGRVDPELFRLSYDYVGDLAETTSLIWSDQDSIDKAVDAAADAANEMPLHVAVDALQHTTRRTVSETLADLLDALGQSERYALLKLATGGLRVGVSARLLKIALAQYGDVAVTEIGEFWFGLEPPYVDLFAWLDGRAPPPAVDRTMLFRPVMLAHPLAAEDIDVLGAADFIAEWKWDGIRVQAVAFDGEQRLYTRTGEDISLSFPDVIAAMTFEGVIDGELLIVRDGDVQPFDQLQKRLGRKAPTDALMRDLPAHIYAYDLLERPGEDLRPLPFTARRQTLEHWFSKQSSDRLCLSPLLEIDGWTALERLREDCRTAGLEGLMLKHRDSAYIAGRVKGHWFKWKRDPLNADCVLMYAQRGHGKRSSFYSDYTFGCWSKVEGVPRLVPVGKAYSGYTNAELLQIDKYVRDNTVERFGPVRAVRAGLVFEVAFDAVQPSSRHKSGIAMRFPRIKRVRWDKPADEADHVATLSGLIAQAAS